MKNSFLSLMAVLLLFSASAQDLIKAVDEKDLKTTEQLLKSGANANKPNRKGQFPLWMAVWNEDHAMVSLLLSNGAKVNQVFKGKEFDSNCLEIACQNGLTDIVKTLVEHGADIHKKGTAGNTPLRVAARNGRLDIIAYLIEKGAEVDTKGDDQATPLEAAASKGHIEIVKLLVKRGARVNHQDKDEDTPLSEAAKYGHLEVVEFLLANGADVSLKNKEGHSAEMQARLAGQAKIEELLKSKR